MPARFRIAEPAVARGSEACIRIRTCRRARVVLDPQPSVAATVPRGHTPLCKMCRRARGLLQRTRSSVGRGFGGARSRLRCLAAAALRDEGVLRHSLWPARPLGSPFGEASFFGPLPHVGLVLSDDRQQQPDDRNDEQEKRVRHLECPILRAADRAVRRVRAHDRKGQRALARNVAARGRISCLSLLPDEALSEAVALR